MTFDGGAKEACAFTNSLNHERSQAIALNQASALPIGCVLSLSIVAIVYGHVNLTQSLLWAGLALAVNGVRYVTARLYSSARSSTDARSFLNFCIVSSGVNGCIWGAVPLAFMDVSDPLSICLIVILCGISAGAILQSSAYAAASIPFILPVLGASIWSLLLVGRPQGSILAFDIGLFAIFLTRNGLLAERAFTESAILRHQATTLAEDLFELANRDPLTKLTNRAAFVTALETSLGLAIAEKGSFYLLLVDLDNFKFINDTLGHSAGDDVLVDLAARLSSTLHSRHSLSRIGGDEFAILLDGRCDDEEAHQIADRIVEGGSGMFEVGGHHVNVGVSAGLAKFPDDGGSAEELLGRADLALYAAKESGRHRWRRFDAALLEDAQMVRDLEQDLPEALVDGALEVWFQPQIALDDLRPSGVEALIRWKHPRYGWLAPPLIVKAAQRLRKSDALTGLVLDHACQIQKLLAAAGLCEASVAVNVSPSELDLYDLPALIARTIETHSIAPGRLEIEITEEAFVGGESALATLGKLSKLGVRLAIDDFGTGCSSIAYLRTLQVDRIKIDRTFVSGFVDRSGDRILVQAILGIGRSFGIEVVAEGVETGEEAALLAEYGCPLAQGHHFGHPMSRAQLLVWLVDHVAGGNVAFERPADQGVVAA